MSDVYRNSSVVLTNNNQTTVYTVPTADASIVPKQKPVQALVSSIRACNKSGGALTLTLVYTDASLDCGQDWAVHKAKDIHVKVIQLPMGSGTGE